MSTWPYLDNLRLVFRGLPLERLAEVLQVVSVELVTRLEGPAAYHVRCAVAVLDQERLEALVRSATTEPPAGA